MWIKWLWDALCAPCGMDIKRGHGNTSWTSRNGNVIEHLLCNWAHESILMSVESNNIQHSWSNRIDPMLYTRSKKRLKAYKSSFNNVYINPTLCLEASIISLFVRTGSDNQERYRIATIKTPWAQLMQM